PRVILALRLRATPRATRRPRLRRPLLADESVRARPHVRCRPCQTSEDTLNPRSGVVHEVIDTPTRSTPVRASTHSVNAEAPLCRARRAADPPERHRLGVGVLDGRERAPRFIV